MPGRGNHRPRCSGLLADGRTPCNRYAVDAGLCAVHLAQAEPVPAAEGHLALCAGATVDGLPCSAHRMHGSLYCAQHQDQGDGATIGPVDEEPADEAEALALVGIDPATWRSTLQSNLAGNAGLVLRTLLQTIAAASNGRKLTCPHCRNGFEANIKDHRAALDGIRLWNEMGFGKPKDDDAARRPMRKTIRFAGREVTADTWNVAASQLSDDELDAMLGGAQVEVEAA